jgi:hypothetical protein
MRRPETRRIRVIRLVAHSSQAGEGRDSLHLKLPIPNFEMFLRPAPEVCLLNPDFVGAQNNLAQPGKGGEFKTARSGAACLS